MPVAARAATARMLVAMLVLSLAHRARAQSEADDSVGWGEEADSDSGDANDAVGFGDPDSGFAESTSDEPSAAPEPAYAEPSPLELGGRYWLRTALWLERFDNNPFAQARNLLGLWASYKVDFTLFGEHAVLRLRAAGRAEYDAAYLVQRWSYATPTIELYEWQLIAEENTLDLAVGAFEIELGMLSTAFGQGEVLGLIAINPRDLRDPSLTDPKDLYLSALGSRVALTLGRHRLDGVVYYQARFGLRAPPIAPLSPLRALLLEDPLAGDALAGFEWRFREEPDGVGLGQIHGLGRYTFTGEGIDFELYGGSLLDSVGVTELPEPGDFNGGDITLVNYHPRYAFFAHAAALPVGEVVVRWELAASLDRPQMIRRVDSAVLQLEFARLTQLGAMVGITYFGWQNTNIGLEVQQGFVLDNPERVEGSGRELLLPVEVPQLALRLRRTFFRERLQLDVVALLIAIPRFNSLMARAELSYALTDGLWLALGGVTYHPTEEFGPFYGFEENDRGYIALRWDFTLL